MEIKQGYSNLLFKQARREGFATPSCLAMRGSLFERKGYYEGTSNQN
jgi:hypothetical protein